MTLNIAIAFYSFVKECGELYLSSKNDHVPVCWDINHQTNY